MIPLAPGCGSYEFLLADSIHLFVVNGRNEEINVSDERSGIIMTFLKSINLYGVRVNERSVLTWKSIDIAIMVHDICHRNQQI